MKRLIKPLFRLLEKGVSPGQLSLAVTLGIVLALIPAFGTSTLLCLMAIAVLRVNPLAILLVNQFAYPLQFLLYLPFIRAGEWLFNSEKLPFSVSQILEMIQANVFNAVSLLWWSTIHAIIVWVIMSIIMFPIFYFFFRIIFIWLLNQKCKRIKNQIIRNPAGPNTS